MTSRTRLWVLAVSTPVIAFALVGGYLGKAAAREETYQHLKTFQDVFALVVSNYVEEVDVRVAMRGAMRGLADGLDPDSAYLTPDLVKTFESNAPAGPGDVGLDVVRQYYLRITSVRPGSSAAKAGLRTGDYVRAIDGRATREVSSYEGMRLLSGAVGSSVRLLVIRGNAADPHEVTLTRERPSSPEITSRMADASTGYVRLIDFRTDAPARLKQTVDGLAKSGATRFIIDLRGASTGDLDNGVAAARAFVKSGTIAIKQTKDRRETITAQTGDGSITAPLALLVDQGTAGAAEIFAGALDGHERASLIGDRTVGRAARQRLVKLPDGSGLLMTVERYLTPQSVDIHEKGLAPDLEVEEAEVDFGAPAPTTDAALDRALQYFAQKKAA
jgi:carboxyl-terminal processing protease